MLDDSMSKGDCSKLLISSLPVNVHPSSLTSSSTSSAHAVPAQYLPPYAQPCNTAASAFNILLPAAPITVL